MYVIRDVYREEDKRSYFKFRKNAQLYINHFACENSWIERKPFKKKKFDDEWIIKEVEKENEKVY